MMLRIYKKYVDVYLNKCPDGIIESQGWFIIEDEANTQEQITFWAGRAKIREMITLGNPENLPYRITCFTKKFPLFSIWKNKFITVQQHDILYKKIWYQPVSISMKQLMQLPAEKVAAYFATGRTFDGRVSVHFFINIRLNSGPACNLT